MTVIMVNVERSALILASEVQIMDFIMTPPRKTSNDVQYISKNTNVTVLMDFYRIARFLWDDETLSTTVTRSMSRQ